MNTVSRIASGIIAFIIGVFTLYITISDGVDMWSQVWGIAWGVFACSIGVYLFFNKKEDQIEKIKNKSE